MTAMMCAVLYQYNIVYEYKISPGPGSGGGRSRTCIHEKMPHNHVFKLYDSLMAAYFRVDAKKRQRKGNHFQVTKVSRHYYRAFYFQHEVVQ